MVASGDASAGAPTVTCRSRNNPRAYPISSTTNRPRRGSLTVAVAESGSSPVVISISTGSAPATGGSGDRRRQCSEPLSPGGCRRWQRVYAIPVGRPQCPGPEREQTAKRQRQRNRRRGLVTGDGDEGQSETHEARGSRRHQQHPERGHESEQRQDIGGADQSPGPGKIQVHAVKRDGLDQIISTEKSDEEEGADAARQCQRRPDTRPGQAARQQRQGRRRRRQQKRPFTPRGQAFGTHPSIPQPPGPSRREDRQHVQHGGKREQQESHPRPQRNGAGSRPNE